jgi:peptide/nickel transport system substrate-binding protein
MDTSHIQERRCPRHVILNARQFTSADRTTRGCKKIAQTEFREEENMKGKESDRIFTRREFVRFSALLAAGTVVSSCTPAATSTPGPTSAPAMTATSAPAMTATSAPAMTATSAITATPSVRRGGTLTWGQWDKNDSLDPAINNGAAALEIIGNVFDSLVAIDGDLNVYPVLAESWTVEDDSEKFTFVIRDDVKFHDGSPLTADAVKRTWDRILDPDSQAAAVAYLLGPVDEITAPDARTLVVTFTEPYPLFLQSIWRPYYAIVSPKVLDSLEPGGKIDTFVGSGPFKYVGRSADGVVTLEANPDYAWGPEFMANRKAPYLERVEFRAITETATRVATLESGESLLVDQLSEPEYARLKSDERFHFVEAPRVGVAIGFCMNVQKPPMDELAVRQALNYAVDRQAIVDKLYFGVHKVNVGILTEGVWARLDELEELYGYDPEKARQILDAAGWKVGTDGIRERDGEKLSLTLVTFRPPWSEIAEVVQSQYREVGIDVQAQLMERNPYLDFVRSYQHHLCASAGAGLDPDQLRERLHSSGITAGNFYNTADPTLDALLEKGAKQPILSQERRETYEEIQRYLMDYLPFVSIMGQIRVQAMSAKVHDLKMNPEGLNAYPLTDTWLEA